MGITAKQLAAMESAWLKGQDSSIAELMVNYYRVAVMNLETELLKVGSDFDYARLLSTQYQLKQIIEDFESRTTKAVGDELARVAREAGGRAQDIHSQFESTLDGLPLEQSRRLIELPVLVPQRAVRHFALQVNMDLGVLTQGIKRDLFAELTQSTIQGESVNKMVARLKRVVPMEATGTGTARAYNHRLRTIARMRTADARTTGTQEAHKSINKRRPGSVRYEMILDTVDKTSTTRNHFFSWAASNTIRDISKGEPFKVSQAQVQAAQAEYTMITGRKARAKGIIWELKDGYYQGFGVPAHFVDRATIVAYHPGYQLAGLEPKYWKGLNTL